MGKIKAVLPVKLIVSIMYRHEALLAQALETLVARWGAVDILSEALPFDYTDYYEKEMGPDLQRRLISFRRLLDPGDLAAIKGATNQMEETLSGLSWPKRLVNIDPGYITANHLILATTKPAPHRPYVQQGIYADLTLVFQNTAFQPLSWTYPDYRSEKMVAILCAIRQKYLFQQKHESLEQGKLILSRE